MPRPINPSPHNSQLASCEVCWADSNETHIYRYKGTTYCELDLERARIEGWHKEESNG